MGKKTEEWFKQADYDIETANLMFKGGRYFYAVFMSHLAIEKSIKGVYQNRLNSIPPKTHNLIYLLNKAEIVPPEEIGKFLIKINQASVVTRYPEDLATLQRDYTQEVVRELLKKTKETVKWIKNTLKT